MMQKHITKKKVFFFYFMVFLFNKLFVHLILIMVVLGLHIILPSSVHCSKVSFFLMFQLKQFFMLLFLVS